MGIRKQQLVLYIMTAVTTFELRESIYDGSLVSHGNSWYVLVLIFDHEVCRYIFDVLSKNGTVKTRPCLEVCLDSFSLFAV